MIARILCILLCTWPSLAVAERYALAIGNNLGDSDEETLRWAEDDARRTKDLLTELGDVPAEHARLLIGATAAELRSELAALRAQLERAGNARDSVLLAYYSGHGDADSLHMSGSRLPLRELESLLRGMPVATLVTIVDACRDQPSIRNKGAHHSEPFDISVSREAGPSGRVMITAADRNEIAQESDKLRSSFFTHHLLSGMRGAADRDGDRQVSLDELYSYSYHNTLASSHAHLAAVQHPQMAIDLHGEGDLVITRLRRARSTLELAPSIGGDVMIVDDRNAQVVAELYKPFGKAARVALSAGRFRIQVRDGNVAYAGEIGLEWGGYAAISDTSLERQDLREVQRKGHHLDPKPWLAFANLRAGLATSGSEAMLWSSGARVGLERERMRWLVDLQLGAAAAAQRSYVETRLGLGLGPRIALGSLQLFIGATGGILHVHERAHSTSGSALGAYLAPLLSFEIPLLYECVIALQGELQLALLRIDDNLRLRPTPSAALAFGKHF